jgi:hypothetical protein
MMKDVHGKLNAELQWKKKLSREEGSKLELSLGTKKVKCCIWDVVLCGAEIGILQV